MSGKLSERKEMQIRICGKKMEYRFEDILEIRNGKNQKAVENPEGRYPIYGSGGVIGYADDYICEADLSVLQESPFTDRGSVVEIFTDLSVWMGIRKVIDMINANAVA